MSSTGRRALRNAAFLLVSVLVLLLAYGLVIEPRVILDERRHTVELPNLPPEQDGTTVAVFSDIQVGMWWANTGMVERVVDRVVEADPDMVLLPGDFIYGTDTPPPEQIDEVLRLLAPLTDSGTPMFAVLGNHDHTAGAADELTTALEEAGIEVLHNQAVALPGSEGAARPLHVVGIGPEGLGLADPERALAGVPEDAPRLVMTHYPSAFPLLPAGSAPLTVAAHTHCGQIAFPGSPIWSMMGLTEEERDAAAGWAPDDYGAPGNRMFVTCGVGFSILPMRFNAPPQLVLLELSSERTT